MSDNKNIDANIEEEIYKEWKNTKYDSNKFVETLKSTLMYYLPVIIILIISYFVFKFKMPDNNDPNAEYNTAIFQITMLVILIFILIFINSFQKNYYNNALLKEKNLIAFQTVLNGKGLNNSEQISKLIDRISNKIEKLDEIKMYSTDTSSNIKSFFSFMGGVFITIFISGTEFNITKENFTLEFLSFIQIILSIIALISLYEIVKEAHNLSFNDPKRQLGLFLDDLEQINMSITLNKSLPEE